MASELDHLASTGEVTLAEGVAYVIDRLSATDRLAASSAATFVPIWRGFTRYASRACGVEHLTGIDRDVICRYLDAPTRTNTEPGVATRHLRRAALRHLFRALRDAGLMVVDPTLDIRLPSRAPKSFRPLTTVEVERCRAASLATLLATREPSTWALAEVGATGIEIGEVRVEDVAGRVVHLSGGPKNEARAVTVTTWGERALERRLMHLDGSPWLVSATTSASPHSRRTAALESLRKTLRRAGVAGPGVGPRSVTAWAGVQLYATDYRIEDVARGLGLRSLDQAATLIGLDWRSD